MAFLTLSFVMKVLLSAVAAAACVQPLLACDLCPIYAATEAQGGTFTELELGVEELPQKRSLRGRTMTALHTKTFLRHAVEKTFDGLRRVLTRSPAS